MPQPQIADAKYLLESRFRAIPLKNAVIFDMRNYVANMRKYFCAGQNKHAYVHVSISRNMAFYAPQNLFQ